MKITNICVEINQKQILRDINLCLDAGQIHILMGPNGSGKSTLAYALMGHPSYQITNGSIVLNTVNITHLSPDKRAQAGLFLAFQNPYEIPGVTVFNFLKEAHYAVTKKVMSTQEFQNYIYAKMALLEMDTSFAHRCLNFGFSGGEKKKLELLQLLVLCPQIAILDEIDSGLDVDAIKIVAQGLHAAKRENPNLSILLITHYPRLLHSIQPDFVHIMNQGTLVQSGSAALAYEIEQKGYAREF